jgi:outer membrane protein assembly factor BamD (BamD/ComL family)
MKKALMIMIMVFSLALSGCSGQKAEELFETAQFEELQKNQKHARQLYQEIIDKYPKSEYAKKAEERLAALRKDQ